LSWRNSSDVTWSPFHYPKRVAPNEGHHDPDAASVSQRWRRRRTSEIRRLRNHFPWKTTRATTSASRAVDHAQSHATWRARPIHRRCVVYQFETPRRSLWGGGYDGDPKTISKSQFGRCKRRGDKR
ncbi:unnamed protein product, partial [Ixodes pacificus]